MSQPDDRTLDADPASVERIREIARQATAGDPGGAHGERTLDADESTLAQLRALAAAAEQHRHEAQPAPARLPPRDLAELELPDVAELGARRPPTPATVDSEPWRPPARSVRPAALPEVAPQHATHPIWRTLAIALAVVVLVLAGWLVFGGDGSTDEQPSGPTVTGPSGTVVVTGIIEGEGGSGG